jgi:hypothetical protein
VDSVMIYVYAGIALYVGKTFLTQLMVPKKVKRIIYKNKFTLGMMDIGLTTLAGHFIAGGSVTGMIVMISFCTCSFLYIVIILGTRRLKELGGGICASVLR